MFRNLHVPGALLGVLLLFALVLFPTWAQTESLSYNGTINPSITTWHSPDVTDNPCSPAASILVEDSMPFGYHAQPFTVDTTGIYTLATLTSSLPDMDTVLYLYSPSFVPYQPLAGLVAANDDIDYDNGVLRAQLQCVLRADTSYVLVTTSYQHGTTSTFTNTIEGPGTVWLHELVPTPTVAPTWTPTLQPTRTPRFIPTPRPRPGRQNQNEQ